LGCIFDFAWPVPHPIWRKPFCRGQTSKIHTPRELWFPGSCSNSSVHRISALPILNLDTKKHKNSFNFLAGIFDGSSSLPCHCERSVAISVVRVFSLVLRDPEGSHYETWSAAGWQCNPPLKACPERRRRIRGARGVMNVVRGFSLVRRDPEGSHYKMRRWRTSPSRS